MQLIGLAVMSPAFTRAAWFGRVTNRDYRDSSMNTKEYRAG